VRTMGPGVTKRFPLLLPELVPELGSWHEQALALSQAGIGPSALVATAPRCEEVRYAANLRLAAFASPADDDGVDRLGAGMRAQDEFFGIRRVRTARNAEVFLTGFISAHLEVLRDARQAGRGSRRAIGQPYLRARRQSMRLPTGARCLTVGLRRSGTASSLTVRRRCGAGRASIVFSSSLRKRSSRRSRDSLGHSPKVTTSPGLPRSRRPLRCSGAPPPPCDSRRTSAPRYTTVSCGRV